uniref:Uncharacterized protein n=1 Tax=Cynoglossus semilaevis TaxID=244447 RepID=A0A3P8W3A4_CYNSE
MSNSCTGSPPLQTPSLSLFSCLFIVPDISLFGKWNSSNVIINHKAAVSVLVRQRGEIKADQSRHTRGRIGRGNGTDNKMQICPLRSVNRPVRLQLSRDQCHHYGGKFQYIIQSSRCTPECVASTLPTHCICSSETACNCYKITKKKTPSYQQGSSLL